MTFCKLHPEKLNHFYIVVLVLELSRIILNCFSSPVLKRQFILLSKMLQLECYQGCAPYLTIFFSLLKFIYGIVEKTRLIKISTVLKVIFYLNIKQNILLDVSIK